jgi:hypothetical protein
VHVKMPAICGMRLVVVQSKENLFMRTDPTDPTDPTHKGAYKEKVSLQTI